MDVLADRGLHVVILEGLHHRGLALVELLRRDAVDLFGEEAAFAAAPNLRGAAIANLTGSLDFFAARGIAKDQANKCLADSKTAEKLATMSNEQGQKYNIEGTPTFFINGKKQDFNTWPQLKDALIKAGAR